MSLIKTMEQVHSININSAWKALPMASFFKTSHFRVYFLFLIFFLPTPLNENLMLAMAPTLMKKKK